MQNGGEKDLVLHLHQALPSPSSPGAVHQDNLLQLQCACLHARILLLFRILLAIFAVFNWLRICQGLDGKATKFAKGARHVPNRWASVNEYAVDIGSWLSLPC